jgi:hypothetical protein
LAWAVGWRRRWGGGALPARRTAREIITDLAVAVALGGDCLADIAVLRAQLQLFRPVASDPVVSRLITRLRRRSSRAGRSARPALPPVSGPGRWLASTRLARTGA